MCAPVCAHTWMWSWGRGQRGVSTVSRHRLAGEASPKRKFTALYLPFSTELERAYVFYLSLPVEEILFHEKQTSASWKTPKQISGFVHIYILPLSFSVKKFSPKTFASNGHPFCSIRLWVGHILYLLCCFLLTYEQVC